MASLKRPEGVVGVQFRSQKGRIGACDEAEQDRPDDGAAGKDGVEGDVNVHAFSEEWQGGDGSAEAS